MLSPFILSQSHSDAEVSPCRADAPAWLIFTEWGRQIRITRTCKDGFDAFWDAFIGEAIEANGCYCGGGGCEDELDFVVELGKCSENPDAKIKKITAWLDTRQDVRCWQVSEAFDLWHGECPELH